MKIFTVIAALVGLAAIIALVGYFGAGAIIDALLAVGIAGFLAICGVHLVLTGFMGLAWRALLPGVPSFPVMWARLIRDSAAEALPLSQVGGYVLGVRALAMWGVGGTIAAATTIVDVTLEFMAQLIYTALGLALLVWYQPETEVVVPVLIGLAVGGVAAGAFVVTQRRGFDYVGRMAGILGEGWAERTAAGANALRTALDDVYRGRVGLWVSGLLHFACWIASAIEIWLALKFAGEPLPFTAVLAIESLLYAIRTMFFVVPQGVGVQEGAYVLLGSGFGLSPDIAIALSLLKRARDLTIGLPAIAIWQLIEGGRLLRRRDAGVITKTQLPDQGRGG